MNYQAYLRRNELVFVEQRLKQYQHIVREMEKRRAALRASLGYRDPSLPEPFNTILENLRSAFAPLLRGQQSAAVGKAPSASAASELLKLLSKENVVDLLGEANVRLKSISDVLAQAEKNVETFSAVIELLESKGPEVIKSILEVIDQARVLAASPAAVSGGKPEETAAGQSKDYEQSPLYRLLSDAVQSPLYQKLSAKYKT